MSSKTSNKKLNKKLNRNIKRYLNSQDSLSMYNKEELKVGFININKKLASIRQSFGLDSLRGMKVYLFDSENIGRTKSPVWSANRIIEAYNDFEKDNFFRNGRGPVRIPLIFLYENRKDKFIEACVEAGKNMRKINRFIIELSGDFADHLRDSIRHFSPDDMQIIHYANMLKIYKNNFPIGSNCKNCIKGVRIVSKDKFRDHPEATGIPRAPHTVRKGKVRIPRTVQKISEKVAMSHDDWHRKKFGKAPSPHFRNTLDRLSLPSPYKQRLGPPVRLSPVRHTKKRSRRRMISSPSDRSPIYKKRINRRGGKKTRKKKKTRKIKKLRKRRRTYRRRRV